MKLKNYLSTKKLRRKLSKFNINESHCNTNDSFTDYTDNDAAQMDVVSKDDMYLRPKKEGRCTTRSDMTKSLTGHLPSSYLTMDIKTEATLQSVSPKRVDHASQTDLQLSNYDSLQQSINSDTENSMLCSYKDNINGIELPSHVHPEYRWENSSKKTCTCGENRMTECCSCVLCTSCSCWQYQSLPSSQTNSNITQSIHYNSLPSSLSSMTQSIYIPSELAAAASQSATSESATSESAHQCSDKWRRSRIKTNPWLPLPKENSETLRRKRRVNKRAQPRLSRFFSEVEELMREQLSITSDDMTTISLSDGRFLPGSNESLASTCSTATEIPVRKMDKYDDMCATMGSPSEGYKSACCSISSDLNLADTESFTNSRGSSSSELSKYSDSGRCLSSSHCPPSLQDFTASLTSDSNWTSSNSLLSESMFASSTYSPKYEALEDKVRKLCQSTSDLGEKMRLARMECSYIKVK